MAAAFVSLTIAPPPFANQMSVKAVRTGRKKD